MTSEVQASRVLDIAIIDLLKHPSLRRLLGLESEGQSLKAHRLFPPPVNLKLKEDELTSLPCFLPVTAARAVRQPTAQH